MKKIELSYQKNVRDLGGLVAFNGMKVKEGKIYRGGFLGRVSNDDILKINSLIIQTDSVSLFLPVRGMLFLSDLFRILAEVFHTADRFLKQVYHDFALA